MEMRFINGKADFNYAKVDESDEYDDQDAERREAEDKYFDEEEPHIASRSTSTELQGQTGVQDF